MNSRTKRIEIFNSNLQIFSQGKYIAPSGKVVELPSSAEVVNSAVMYREEKSLDLAPSTPVEPIIQVVENDCVLAAKQLIEEGYNPAMLNLADLFKPGGLIEFGSGAQEENLCRRSNLIMSLYPFSSERVHQYPQLNLSEQTEQYPMDAHFGGMYSRIVTFFRGTESDGYTLLEEPYNIPVISVAALHNPRINEKGMLIEEDANQTKDKIRTIFRIGAIQGHDSLVLSAFGCGAFGNPPEHIAKLFHEVILEDEFRYAFRLICFAILDGYRTGMAHNPRGNFLPFKEEFDK